MALGSPLEKALKTGVHTHPIKDKANEKREASMAQFSSAAVDGPGQLLMRTDEFDSTTRVFRTLGRVRPTRTRRVFMGGRTKAGNPPILIAYECDTISRDSSFFLSEEKPTGKRDTKEKKKSL